MSSRIASKTYGTVSADKRKVMSGLEFVQGLVDGSLPLNTIAKTLGYNIIEAERGRVVINAEPNDTLLNPAGTVQVIGPALVERVVPLDYQAVTTEGARLGREVKGLELGFYAVKSDGRLLTFFVGTRAEFDAIRGAEMQSDLRPDRPKSGGSGGGRHGGKRSQQPPDPSAINGE